MTLLDVLKKNIAIKNVRVGFYGEDVEKYNKKIASDLSILVFTEDGLKEFREVLNIPIKQIKDGNIYLFANRDKTKEEKITYFWNLYTRLGRFDWKGVYDYSAPESCRKATIDEILEHRRFFEFTAEMQLVC